MRKNPIYTNTIAKTKYTVFTDKTGAHRVFKTKDYEFKSYDGQYKAIDQNGDEWTVKENTLISSKGKSLERLQTHNAFWFGYKAAFPEVVLVK